MTNYFDIKGLTSAGVLQARKEFGYNKLDYKRESGFIASVTGLVKDPMIILLFLASFIYFLTGNTGDAIFLSSAIVLVSIISLYQDSRSRNALDKLKNFTQPKCKVMRNAQIEEIKSENLVVGDSLMVEEGTSIPADGTIVHSNDFSVDESILTGESLAVFKDQTKKDNLIYQGTTVSSGLAIATINAIGVKTKLGKIGKSLENIKEEKTPLELQINQFVRRMILVGAIIFFVVWVLNYFDSFNILGSFLKALTLAMSILPEEIPVAFTTFMALGAWRLMKSGIVVKQMKTVETLGSATVICTDKTGTITENKMSLAKIFVLESQNITSPENISKDNEMELIKLAMFASEPIPYDAMEVALHQTYSNVIQKDERSEYMLIREYPLSGKPPMMTHIFENREGKRIVAVKGAPEALIHISNLKEAEKQQINDAIQTFAKDGYRVLAVGEAYFIGNNFPLNQHEFKFQFKGVLAFYDPPKKNIQSVFEKFYAAGISVKIVTGDNAATTISIAKQVGFRGYDKSLTGDELMKLTDAELQERVMDINVFTRMFPEAKLKIINALKARNEIVAMTGDGVNDAPALKAANIGIAMGKKGTEIAKQAASLILMDDDLSKMVDAIAIGRKIYSNLKKSIQYIISIHIPIIFTVFIPLAFGWVYPNIFSPIHIIFLELIMGPTCSIIYENEPMEKNIMLQKPRPLASTFFNWRELTTSILQGLMITAGTLLAYHYAVHEGFSESVTRTMVFTVLISSNIFLTLVNRSFYYSMIVTMNYKNNLVLFIICFTIAMSGLILYVNPLIEFFNFEILNLSQLLISLCIGFLFVTWYELIKWGKRAKVIGN